MHRMTPVKYPGSYRRKRFAHFVPWPVDDPRDFRENNAEGPRRVLVVGKLRQARKNHSVVVEALSSFLETGEATLTIVGSSKKFDEKGSDIYKKLKARSEGLPNFNIIEDVPFKEMSALYREHEFCVLPAFGELLGVAPIEAMAYGCIPIVSRTSGCSGYITAGHDGFLFNPDDQDQLRLLFGRVFADDNLRTAVASAALETARTELGSERFLERFHALADELKWWRQAG